MPVFQIGLTGLGTTWLRRVFRRSGYAVASGESDRLAVDIRYSQLTGTPPLTAFADVDLFTDMEALRSVTEPPLAGQLAFAFLDESFPDAYFLLNVGDVDAWVRRRLHGLAGPDHLRAVASREGVEPGDLPELWRGRWERHEAAVRAHFEGRDRFLVLDVETQGLDELAAFVAPAYRLDTDNVPRRPRRPRAAPPFAVPAGPLQSGPVDTALVHDVVAFATASNPDVPTGLPYSKASRLYAYWDGADAVLRRNGRPLPCAIDRASPDWPFLLNDPWRQQRRTEGALNELWQHGLRRGAHVDMQDARRYGVASTGAPASSVVAFCRRQGAAGLVLWPLPGYHTPGTPDFPSAFGSADTVAFADKLDSLAWRGNLTGRALPELGEAGAGNEHATDLVRQLGEGDDDRARAALDTVPRFRVLTRWADRPDADVGLVLGDGWDAGVPPPLARLVRPRLAYADLYRHRYLLSLSGNDGASNFLKVADSQSVVLREEDGWEWFYDGVFRPWEHYIPLVRGGDDLAERLDWARSHPDECQEMSSRAREVVRGLVSPDNRRAYLHNIREIYETRFVPR